ncbi:hypothetical protein [Aerolutibacter ruishenii]|uniref:Uncharacterized protein n=1 Tax=Aerolutibacter ruishenii TaxID=686800 RepID=A0A562LGJ0_9GAMM|nr:hypothetical protein [Lysobacter ruishenii]TWI06721.1 hypothetical protein IP93_02944 [Lysobacter ruishenii]
MSAAVLLQHSVDELTDQALLRLRQAAELFELLLQLRRRSGERGNESAIMRFATGAQAFDAWDGTGAPDLVGTGLRDTYRSSLQRPAGSAMLLGTDAA